MSNTDTNSTETTRPTRDGKSGGWVDLPHGRREWRWDCGCRATTPDSFWVNSCSTHSLLNK